MMDRRASKSAALGKTVGWLAFVWRLVLTTGTGSIFGFLIAREAYNSAIMAPLFIAASFLYGLSFTVLVLLMMCRETRQELMTPDMRRSFQGLLVIFSLAVLFFTAVQHLTNFYSPERRGVELFLLRDGGIYPLVFWLGQIVVGSLVPLAILVFSSARRKDRTAIMAAATLFLSAASARCMSSSSAARPIRSTLPGDAGLELVLRRRGRPLRSLAAGGAPRGERNLALHAIGRAGAS